MSERRSVRRISGDTGPRAARVTKHTPSGVRRGGHRRNRWSSGAFHPQTSTFFILTCVVSLPLVALNPTALAGDPQIYLSRLAEVLGGHLPYIDAQFEHLPLAALPIVLAWALGGWFHPDVYTAVFAVLMAVCLWATAALVDQSGAQLSIPNAGVRWLWIAGPLFPLVLFRSDPWPLVLATAGFAAFVAKRNRAALGWVTLGILAKGWPLVLSALDWFRGRRTRALVLILASLGMFAVLWSLPGFRSGREFSGTHTDTMVGSLLALLRAVQGEPVGRFDAAGAIYLTAPDWAFFVNANLGIVLGALALVRLRRPLTDTGAAKLGGALILALLVGSPLLSPQFILWPTALLALHPSRTVRSLSIAVAACTLVFMLGWNPVYEGTLWWLPIVTLRNLLMLVLGLLVSWSMGLEDGDGEKAHRPIRSSNSATVNSKHSPGLHYSAPSHGSASEESSLE